MSHPRIEEVSDSSSTNSDPDEVALDDDFNDTDILLQRAPPTSQAQAAQAAAQAQAQQQIPRNPPVPAPQNTQQPATTPDRPKYADFQQITRSRTLDAPIGSRAVLDELISELAGPLFPARRGIRLLGVTLSSLDAGDGDGPRIARQLQLPI